MDKVWCESLHFEGTFDLHGMPFMHYLKTCRFFEGVSDYYWFVEGTYCCTVKEIERYVTTLRIEDTIEHRLYFLSIILIPSERMENGCWKRPKLELSCKTFQEEDMTTTFTCSVPDISRDVLYVMFFKRIEIPPTKLAMDDAVKMHERHTFSTVCLETLFIMSHDLYEFEKVLVEHCKCRKLFFTGCECKHDIPKTLRSFYFITEKN